MRTAIFLAILLTAFPFPSKAEDTAASAELDSKEFTRLIELLTPESSKPWRSIPWKLSVLEGQQAAAKSGKPIFIWAMDGHPLGCT